MRARFIYSKRGGACFVPHIALAQLFSRAAVRAGLKLAMTQGFSPRAKISFGPELPAGVVALNEPVDMYFVDDSLQGTRNPERARENSQETRNPDNSQGNSQGTCKLEGSQAISQETCDLGDLRENSHDICRHKSSQATSQETFNPESSRATLEVMNNSLPEGFNISQVIFPDDNSPSIGKLCTHAEYLARTSFKLNDYAQKFFGDNIILHEECDDWLRFIIKAPAQNPIGGFVKFLISENAINGWHEINLVRAAIGQFNGEKVYLP